MDWSMRGLVRHANRMVEPLVRSGLPMGSRRSPMALLTVRGRKSGLPRTVPVALIPIAGGWRLISVYGVTDWSKNLDVAGEATVTQRGTTTRVAAERLAPAVAARVLQEAMADAPAMIKRMTSRYFRAGAGSPREDWEREAEQHPVFDLRPLLDPEES